MLLADAGPTPERFPRTKPTQGSQRPFRSTCSALRELTGRHRRTWMGRARCLMPGLGPGVVLCAYPTPADNGLRGQRHHGRRARRNSASGSGARFASPLKADELGHKSS